jgi:ketosteroid isomerase-like protein
MGQRRKIQQQLNRYSDAVNRRDWAAFATLYAKNAIWEGTGALAMRFEGREAITRGFAGIIDPMSMFVQMNAPAVIDLRGDRALARSTIHELGDVPADGMRFELYGRYEDELIRHHGDWLFHHRRFVPVTRQTGPVPANDWAFSA